MFSRFVTRGGLTPLGAPRHTLVWGPPILQGGGLPTKIGLFQGPHSPHLSYNGPILVIRIFFLARLGPPLQVGGPRHMPIKPRSKSASAYVLA